MQRFVFFPFTKDPDPKNGIKMKQKLLSEFLLPLAIYLSGYDLFKMSCFSYISMVTNLDILYSVSPWRNYMIPSRPNPGRREKINLNFYFHTSLWCLKRFYEDLKAFIKPFEAPQRSVKITTISTWLQLQVILESSL